MPEGRQTPSTLHEGLQGRATDPSEPSGEPSTYLTLREAADTTGCSESTLRRLVKAGDVPFAQEETNAGFRYLFRPSDIPLIAHKAAMRRPRGRRVEGPALQPSAQSVAQEDVTLREELAAIRAERDLFRSENARLWEQVQRLTESVTRLALPAGREEEPKPERPSERRRGFWDWFWGRG